MQHYTVPQARNRITSFSVNHPKVSHLWVGYRLALFTKQAHRVTLDNQQACERKYPHSNSCDHQDKLKYNEKQYQYEDLYITVLDCAIHNTLHEEYNY